MAVSKAVKSSSRVSSPRRCCRDELILQPVVDEVFGCDARIDEALDLPDEIAFVEALTEAGGDACPALLTGKGDAEG